MNDDLKGYLEGAYLIRTTLEKIDDTVCQVLEFSNGFKLIIAQPWILVHPQYQ